VAAYPFRKVVKTPDRITKSMKSHPIALPEISSSYEDEYGEIDITVYLVGNSIWPYAQAFALRITNDEEQARDLMLRAIALVSKRRKANVEINNIKQYLILVYKRCVFEEAKRAKRFECCGNDKLEIVYEQADEELERVILIKELMAKMDVEMTGIFEKLIVGYSFSEIAAETHASPDVLRNKFRRRLERLRTQMENDQAKNGQVEENGRAKSLSRPKDPSLD
jgi:DNA-directed RNA polymerase specialized sigma24 family protein